MFPIIECTQLEQIIVPADLLSYYQDCLPYYKDIINEKEGLGIKHVNVGFPSADSYTEYEVKQETKPTVLVQEEEKKQSTSISSKLFSTRKPLHISISG